MDKYYSESTLSQSFIYGMFNKNKAMTSKFLKAYRTGVSLDSSYIEEQLIQMKRLRVSSLTSKVLESFEKEDIILIHNSSILIPKAVPFVVVRIGNQAKSLIFVDSFGTVTEGEEVDGGHSLNIPTKDLYALMEGAYVAKCYYETPLKLTRNSGLMKLTSEIYTNMFLRIICKECAISLDSAEYDSIAYCISRFFLENMWECDNHDVVFNYSVNNTSSKDKLALKITDDDYTVAKIVDVNSLINYLRDNFPSIRSNITMRYFTEAWINMYKDTAILAMDTLPYFLFAVSASYMGSFIVNRNLIYDVIKRCRRANIYYSELSKIA